MEKEITNLKINYATMAEKIDNLCDKVDNIDTKLTSYIAHERAREKEMKNSFAGKWVEGVAVGTILTAGGVIIKLLIESL